MPCSDSNNALHISVLNKTAPHKNETNISALNENAPIVNMHIASYMKLFLKTQFLFDIFISVDSQSNKVLLQASCLSK